MNDISMWVESNLWGSGTWERHSISSVHWYTAATSPGFRSQPLSSFFSCPPAVLLVLTDERLKLPWRHDTCQTNRYVNVEERCLRIRSTFYSFLQRIEVTVFRETPICRRGSSCGFGDKRPNLEHVGLVEHKCYSERVAISIEGDVCRSGAAGILPEVVTG
jgi:hypothetical protein